MKTTFLLYIFFVFLLSCGSDKSSEPKDERKIEQITTDKEIVGDFDRKKYPILQNAILLKLDGKLEQSISEFDKAEKEYGEMIQIYLNRGVVFDQLGQFKKSETDFTNCLKIDSTYLPALLNRGLIYAHSDRIEKAMIDFNKAIELQPNEPASYLNRAVAYRKADKIEQACSDLQKAKFLGIKEKYGSEMTNKMIKELECKK